MEKFLEILLNPYCYLVVSALIIVGLTQLIKLIPWFRNNNLNVSFPVIFGFGAAFGWAVLTKLDIPTNMEVIMAFGTGIGTLAVTLYGILKKLFNKNYKMENTIEKSELYTFLSNLLSVDVMGFKDKTMTEKYSFIVSIASNLKGVIDAIQNKNTDNVKMEVRNILNKFVSSGSVETSLQGLMDILKKEYNIPEVKKEENKLVRPK